MFYISLFGQDTSEEEKQREGICLTGYQILQ